MNNSLSDEGAALMNEEMRVSWGTGNGYRWMFDVAIKVEREITETGTGESIYRL